MTSTQSETAERRLEGADFDAAVVTFFEDFDFDLDRGVGQSSATWDIRQIVNAAVDPLEIAAALEAVGVREATIAAHFGHDDVFDLAEHLFQRVPFRLPSFPDPGPEQMRSGGSRDLLRGALFALPGVVFTRSLSLAGVHISWWCLPLALILGWALGQVVASVGYRLRNRDDLDGCRTVVSVLLVTSLIGAAGAVTAVSYVLGTFDWATVIVGSGFVVYMVACGVLLFYDDEIVLVVAMVPTLVAAAVVIVAPGWSGAGPAGLAGIGLAVELVIVAAVYRGSWWRPAVPSLTVRDAAQAGSHLTHGALVGLIVATVLIAPSSEHAKWGAGVEIWPLLLSLGVMEWQQRTLGFRLHRLARSSWDVRSYAMNAQRSLVRSVGVYLLAIVACASAVGAAWAVGEHRVASGRLGAQVLLGVTLCVDLFAAAHACIAHVLSCWLLGLATCVGLVVGFGWGTHMPLDRVIWPCMVGATAVILVSLFLTVRRGVRSPLS